MNLANLAVIVATLLAWASVIPQILKLMRTGDPSGVSTTWPAIGLVSNAAWTAYLASQSLWAAMPSTAVMTLFYGLVLRALHRTGRMVRWALWRGVIWAIVLGTAGATSGWALFGLILGWSYAIQLAPSVWTAYRTPNPRGVSAPTWAIIWVEAALWGLYGWWFADMPVIVFAAVGVSAGTLILARLATVRRRLAVAVTG